MRESCTHGTCLDARKHRARGKSRFKANPTNAVCSRARLFGCRSARVANVSGMQKFSQGKEAAMTPCEVCDRPRDNSGGTLREEDWCDRGREIAPEDNSAECYRIGYERERAARVKAETERDFANATIEHGRDAIRAYCDSENAMKIERDALRAECATLRAALNWCIGHFQGAHPNEPVPAHLLAAEKARKP